MREKPSYTALLRPTHLLISVKSATYTIIWQVRVGEKTKHIRSLVLWKSCWLEKNITTLSDLYLGLIGQLSFSLDFQKLN